MTSNQQDVVGDLCASLAEVGARGSRIETAAGMAARIERVLDHAGGPRALLYEPFDAAERLGLPLALRVRGIELVSVREAGPRMDELRVGLTGARLAIAESGCILVGGDAGGWGLATVLPWVHVAVLSAADVRPTLRAAFAEFLERFQEGEREWVWISGPSKTADIAKTLVTGIHGPNGLEVLIHGARGGRVGEERST